MSITITPSIRTIGVALYLMTTSIAFAQNAAKPVSTDAGRAQEGDAREREKYFYDRLTSGDIKDVSEIKRIGYASFLSMTRGSAFRQEQLPTWQRWGSSISNIETGRTRAIAFDPQNPNAVYLASTVGGLWKTDDYTATPPNWRCLSDNFPSPVVAALAVSQQNGNVIYAGTGEYYPGFTASVGMGLFKSEDGGLNWKNVLDMSILGTSTQQIVIDPTDQNIVYVAAGGLFDGGVFRTTDGGKNWNLLALPSSTGAESIALDPSNTQRIYAGDLAGNLFRSIDAGATWLLCAIPAQSGVRLTTPVVAIAPSTTNIIYASFGNSVSRGAGGLFRSSDFGLTWSLQNDGKGSTINDPNYLGVSATYASSIAIDPLNPNMIYVGGLDGYRSTNAGVTLRAISLWSLPYDSSAFAHADMHFMTVHQGKLFVCDDGGLSIYDGAKWTSAQNEGLPTLQFIGVDADQDLTHLVGGAQDNGVNYLQKGDATWTNSRHGDGGYSWVSPLDGDIVYSTYLYTYIFKSVDGGKTWSDKNAFVSLITNPNALSEGAIFYPPYDVSPDGQVVAFGGGKHVFVSMDGGNDGFAQESTDSLGPVYSVHISPNNPKVMFAGVYEGIFASTDGGLNWASASINVFGQPVGFVQGDNDLTAYAVVSGLSSDSNARFLKTTDGGNSWNVAAQNLPNVPLHSIARDAKGQIFVGTDYGVITSADDGVNWTPFGLGMPLVQVLSLKVKGSNPQYLLAGTHGRGAYLISLAPQSVSAANAVVFDLHDVSPNPLLANRRATISFVTAHDQEATITLYDALGREVEMIAHDRYSSGKHVVSFSSSSLVSGEYFVAFTSEGLTKAKKLVITK